MGHDHHFLSRLDRASEQHVELALSLYRDHELTKYIAASASIATPSRAGRAGDRIAVSCERDEGPFIVLTVEGAFVTCLARGMTPGTLPVFPRTWLDRTMAANARLRQGIARARERTAETTDTGGLLRALWARTHGFTREEFVAARGLAELFGPLWPGAMRQGIAGVGRTLSGVMRRVARGEPPVLENAVYPAYWRSLWGASHFAVLAGCAGEAVGRQFVKEWPLPQSPTGCLWTANIQTISVRAAWFAAQHADVLLPLYDRALAEPTDDRLLRDAVSVLMGMAIKWPSLRKPVLRIFEERRPVIADLQGTYDAYVGIAKALIEEPRAADELVMFHGRKCADWLWTHIDDAERTGRASDELAMTCGVLNPFDMTSGIAKPDIDFVERMANCMSGVACAVRLDAEALFLPEEFVPRFTPDAVDRIMRHNVPGAAALEHDSADRSGA